MRGLDLLSPSHSPKLLADPELAELSVQINQMWPSHPEPLPLAWTETPLVSSLTSLVSFFPLTPLSDPGTFGVCRRSGHFLLLA